MDIGTRQLYIGVLDECSQLSDAGLMVAIRHTYPGRLLFGVGFLWSDLLCYAIGTMMAWGIAMVVDKLKPAGMNKECFKISGLQL